MEDSKTNLNENLSFLQQNQISAEERQKAEEIQKRQNELKATQQQENVINIMSHPSMGYTKIDKENLKK